MSNPVRYAKIKDEDDPRGWPEKDLPWIQALKGGSIEVVAPDNGGCCGCLHFVPPEDVIDLVPESTWGVKRSAVQFID